MTTSVPKSEIKFGRVKISACSAVISIFHGKFVIAAESAMAFAWGLRPSEASSLRLLSSVMEAFAGI